MKQNIDALIEKNIHQAVQDLFRSGELFEDRNTYLRLDKNECLFSFDKELFSQFVHSITPEDISSYPQLVSVYSKLSQFLGVSENQILLTAGADIATRSLYDACLDVNSHVVLHDPGYAMFQVYAKMYGSSISSIPINEHWQPDIENMLACVKKNTKLFVIENPSGTAGSIASEQDIKYCAAELLKKNIIFVIDEVYVRIHKDTRSYVDLMKDYPNIVVIQSFSKSHGFAGLRAGFLIGHEKMMSHIMKVKPMHEITNLTAKTLLWSLEHPEILDSLQKRVLESKKYLLTNLSEIGIPAKDTYSNFIMIDLSKFPEKHLVHQKLKDQKILVRPIYQTGFLKNWIRITVPPISDCKYLIQVLHTLFKN